MSGWRSVPTCLERNNRASAVTLKRYSTVGRTSTSLRPCGPRPVDGLARVLAQTAPTHQMVVFSHDDRLAGSLRRQRIPDRFLSVSRRADSHVEVTPALDPVNQAIDDARAFVMTSGLPAGAAARVVPGFCRVALEAACADLLRRRDVAAEMP